jgi:hypothetical protein
VAGADVIRGWAQDVKRFADDWPRQGGDVLARDVTAQLRADTGGDGRLSHDRRGGAADVQVTASAGQADVVGAGNMGTWAILETGTKSHTTTGRGLRGVVRTPYGPRRTVNVSGVPGRQTWSRGIDQGMGAVEADAARAWGQVGS